MSAFRCKGILLCRKEFVVDFTSLVIPQLQFLQSAHRCFSSTTKEKPNDTFTISYLINSCGLSPETATAALKKVHLSTPDKPDSVLALLREYGFENSHIADLIRKYPLVLRAEPKRNLLPKLQFYHSIGISGTELAKFLSTNPRALTYNLDNRIIPNYEFLRSVVSPDTKVSAVILRSPWIFGQYNQKNTEPNIAFLKDIGVTKRLILFLVQRYPPVVSEEKSKFCKTAKELIEIGFKPWVRSFVFALVATIGTSDLQRKLIIEAYRKWGWGDKEILLAFKKNPQCLIFSEENIMRKMDFLVNKIGFETTDIANTSLVLSYSLEKFMIPRFSVIRVLQLKGLIKRNQRIYYILKPSGKLFLEQYVTKYIEQVPELMDVYLGKVGLHEMGFSHEDIRKMTQEIHTNTLLVKTKLNMKAKGKGKGKPSV